MHPTIFFTMKYMYDNCVSECHLKTNLKKPEVRLVPEISLLSIHVKGGTPRSPRWVQELENRKKSEKLGPGNFARRNLLKLYPLFREKLTKSTL